MANSSIYKQTLCLLQQMKNINNGMTTKIVLGGGGMYLMGFFYICNYLLMEIQEKRDIK